MNIYLDDTRQPPDGFTLMRWPSDVIDALRANNPVVEVVSLDHDIGEADGQTGYDVLLWLEEQVFNGTITEVPEMKVHSANPSARVKMEAAIVSIQRIIADRPPENRVVDVQND